MLIHHSKILFFFPALKRYMTCHAIYWQKARTKSKDIGGSDRLTGGCVCRRVNRFSNTVNLCSTLNVRNYVSHPFWKYLVRSTDHEELKVYGS
jgi:hypothetical protein